MKVVFDTNVLVAAFVTEGICFRLLTRARQNQFQLITCPFILEEFEEVLSKKFSATKDQAKESLQLISEAAHSIVRPTQIITGACRDPDDDQILSCGLAAKADYLVTGDMDLLELREFRGTRIVTPRDFEVLFND